MNTHASSRNHPSSPLGAMTAVMRAQPAASAARMLRVAVIGEGRVLDERLIPRGADVTVGALERNSVVASGEGVPASFRLFERRAGGYVLRVPPGSRGKLVSSGAEIDVADLASKGREGAVRLGSDARGKLIIGSTTLLFQLVPAPPSAMRPQLPEGVKGSALAALDWSMTIIAAFSFLAHFGLVGSLYSDWSDRQVLDDGAIAQGVLHYVEPPPKTPVDEPVAPGNDSSPSPSPSPTAERSPTGQRRPGPGPAVRPSAPQSSDLSAALGELGKLDRQVVGALAPGKGPSTGVILDPTVAPGALDRLAAMDRSIDPHGGSGLHMGPDSGSSVTSGNRSLTLEIPPRTGSTDQGGKPATVDAPAVDKKPPTTDNPGPRPPRTDADRVIAGARARARACYNRGLGANPDMEGGVSFSLSIAGDGHVTAVKASPQGSLSGEVVSCVQGVLSGLHFEASETGQSSISGTFRFVNDSKKR